MRRAALLCTSGALSAFLAAGCAQGLPTEAGSAATRAAPQPTAQPQPTAAAPAQVAPEFDQQFIDVLAPQYQTTLAMARIAQQRATRPELKQLAEQLLSTLDPRIEQLRQWRGQWYGSRETPPIERTPMLTSISMPMPGMAMAGGTQSMDGSEGVQRLAGAPEPFDAAFIDTMVPHHQQVIETARLAVRDAVRPEVRDLAADVIDGQLREIGQLRQWRMQWFGGAPGTPLGAAGSGSTQPQEVRDMGNEHVGD